MRVWLMVVVIAATGVGPVNAQFQPVGTVAEDGVLEIFFPKPISGVRGFELSTEAGRFEYLSNDTGPFNFVLGRTGNKATFGALADVDLPSVWRMPIRFHGVATRDDPVGILGVGHECLTVFPFDCDPALEIPGPVTFAVPEPSGSVISCCLLILMSRLRRGARRWQG